MTVGDLRALLAEHPDDAPLLGHVNNVPDMTVDVDAVGPPHEGVVVEREGTVVIYLCA